MGNSTVAMSIGSIKYAENIHRLVVTNSNVERHAYQKATKSDDFLYY